VKAKVEAYVREHPESNAAQLLGEYRKVGEETRMSEEVPVGSMLEQMTRANFPDLPPATTAVESTKTQLEAESLRRNSASRRLLWPSLALAAMVLVALSVWWLQSQKPGINHGSAIAQTATITQLELIPQGTRSIQTEFREAPGQPRVGRITVDRSGLVFSLNVAFDNFPSHGVIYRINRQEIRCLGQLTREPNGTAKGSFDVSFMQDQEIEVILLVSGQFTENQLESVNALSSKLSADDSEKILDAPRAAMEATSRALIHAALEGNWEGPLPSVKVVAIFEKKPIAD
jgi:hypothetical protein